jgi:multiple antibiotic resistance protein
MEFFLATFTALFSVVNPFGAVPVFVSLTDEYEIKAKNRAALKSSLFMVGILTTFFFAGSFILDFFGIRLEDIRIAGGLLISNTAFGLLSNDRSHEGKRISKEVKQEGMEKDDITFTPMAMPLLSGPGSIALTIGFFEKTGGWWDYLYTVLAITAVALVTYLVLRSSRKINRVLGKGGMAALTKMMGFIILSIGVGMILKGLHPLVANMMGIQ